MGGSEQTPYFALLVCAALLHLLSCLRFDPQVFSFCSARSLLLLLRGREDSAAGQSASVTRAQDRGWYLEAEPAVDAASGSSNTPARGFDTPPLPFPPPLLSL